MVQNNLRQKAFKLRMQGKSYGEIRTVLGIKKSTLSSWFKNLELPKSIKKILKEIEEASGKFILFMDEMHTLVGAGSTQGGMDAANILKPALAKGELRCIGATTLDEYRKYIESDTALERRFQSILVEEIINTGE